VSLILFGMIVAFSSSALLRYRELRDHTAWRRAAAWAAAAQLQRYQAGAELDSQPPPGLISDRISLETSIEPGEHEWAGLVRVTVTATVSRGDRVIARERATGYIRAGGS